MEEKYNKKSIWGSWWEPIRKWFYPAWLAYETSIRFYEYSLSVYHYFLSEHHCIARYVGQLGAQALNVFCTLSTFAICTLFLTLPACFVLFHFFKADNLTNTRWEEKVKMIF